jgi:hypothetical protein
MPELSENLPPPVTPPPAAKPPEPDPEVVRLRAEVATHRQSLDQLRARISAPPQPAVQTQAPSQKEMNAEFYKDPINSTAAIAARVASDLLRNNGQGDRDTLVQMARTQVRAKDPEIFDKYALEIENAVSQAGPQFQTSIHTWEAGFNVIKGQHIDDILALKGQQRAGQGNQTPAVHISSQGGPESPSPRAASALEGDKLTREESNVAKKLGLTDDEYKAGKKAYEGQNDIISDPVGKSSWDQYITFSSSDKRKAERQARKAAKK